MSLEKELAAEVKAAVKHEQLHKTFAPVEVTSPVTGYNELHRILMLAFSQSASGKGRSRHSASPVGVRPWEEQPILANARQLGPAGPAFQVMKKTQESVTMAGNSNYIGAKAEALGAIVYAAALYKLYEEMEQSSLVKSEK